MLPEVRADWTFHGAQFLREGHSSLQRFNFCTVIKWSVTNELRLWPVMPMTTKIDFWSLPKCVKQNFIDKLYDEKKRSPLARSGLPWHRASSLCPSFENAAKGADVNSSVGLGALRHGWYKRCFGKIKITKNLTLSDFSLKLCSLIDAGISKKHFTDLPNSFIKWFYRS